MRIVQKYGGTSLANDALILSAAKRAVQLARQGAQVTLVVSAQGHTTDRLLKSARQLTPTPSARELDAFVAVGEQLSAARTAMAVESLGYPAVSLTGWQAGIETDETFGNALITRVCPKRIEQEMERGSIVVVAGFQGISPNGHITTLGRGGSDTTAVALAAALHAPLCQIFTDVDGVYDKDPNRYPDAIRFSRIGYEQMLELIRDGAQVLHHRCVELAQEKGIALEVLSAFTGAPGTLVAPV